MGTPRQWALQALLICMAALDMYGCRPTRAKAMWPLSGLQSCEFPCNMTTLGWGITRLEVEQLSRTDYICNTSSSGTVPRVLTSHANHFMDN